MPPRKRAHVVKAETQANEIPVAVPAQPEQQQPDAHVEPRPEEPNLVRHETLYLAVGDIALSAVDAHGVPSVVFRVDKAFLARHSSVFATLFGSSSASGERERQYDGVPLISLPDDSDTLEDLLSFMYNPA